MKILQINTSSSSFAVKNFEEDVYRNWYARVAFQLKKFYPKLDVEGWTPETKHKKEKTSEKNRIKFRVFPTNFSLRHGMEISFKMLKALKQEIKKTEDRLIIHFHEYHTWQVYLFLLFIKRNSNVKIIAQHHGGRSPFGNLRIHKRLILFFPVIALMQFFERFLFKKIDIFYALSRDEINYLKKISPNSIIKFQTMGISKEYFKSVNKKEARKKLKLDQKEKYVLYVGRLKVTKGISELLDAVKEMDIKLILIGEGKNYDMYKRYAKLKGIKNVSFLGSVYGKKIHLYYSACDSLILPSYTEGAPVVLMEAMAKDLPVISTDVGGIPLMIKNKVNGLLIKPKNSDDIKNAIEHILKKPFKNIKKYAERFSWEGIIKKTVEDYKGFWKGF
jgi:glycosyltransferase involved in cell wall biosynthesis